MALTKVSRGLLSTGIVDNSNATAITIDSSGNVGIGTTSPDSVIEANTTTSGSGANNNTAGSSIGVGSSGTTQPILGMRWTGASHAGISGNAFSTQIVNDTANSNAFEMYTTGATPLVLGTAATERMRIDASGNVLVSGASGTKMISIDSDSVADSEQAGFFTYGGARNAAISVYKHASITNPCAYLGSQRQNGTQDFVWVSDAGNYMLSTNSAFIGTTSGNVIGAQTSDERLKDIEPAFEYGLAEIMQLVPIAYTMKDDVTAKRMLGFGAQASQGVVPELVYDTGDCIDGYDVDPDNKMIQTACSERTKLGMEYFQAVPVLVKAIQEQQATIEVLTQRIETLENN
jgi:hypothetical protein